MILALGSLSMNGRENVREAFTPTAIDEEAVDRYEIATKDKLKELIDPDYDVWYQGTWEDWHLFVYKGDYEVGGWIGSEPWDRGSFKCSANEVKVKEEMKVDLVDSKSISVWFVRYVIGFSEENATVILKENLSEEIGFEFTIGTAEQGGSGNPDKPDPRP